LNTLSQVLLWRSLVTAPASGSLCGVGTAPQISEIGHFLRGAGSMLTAA